MLSIHIITESLRMYLWILVGKNPWLILGLFAAAIYNIQTWVLPLNSVRPIVLISGNVCKKANCHDLERALLHTLQKRQSSPNVTGRKVTPKEHQHRKYSLGSEKVTRGRLPLKLGNMDWWISALDQATPLSRWNWAYLFKWACDHAWIWATL